MEPATAKAKPQGRLLVSTQLDAKDELEEVGGLGDLNPVPSGPVERAGSGHCAVCDTKEEQRLAG